jgi:hypothetical protein
VIKATRTPPVIVRLYHQQPPKAATKRRTAEGPDQSRNHPLSQALIGPRDLEPAIYGRRACSGRHSLLLTTSGDL